MKAPGDVILGKASLDASDIIRRAVNLPQAKRVRFIRQQLRRKGVGVASEAARMQRKLLAQGNTPNQALFDSMRLAIANQLTQQGVEYIQFSAAASCDLDRVPALGDDARAIGCGITGGVTAIGSLIAGIFGGSGGATAVGAGGAMVGGVIQPPCNAEAMAEAQRLAEAQARTAQANLDAAAATAAGAAALAAEERKTMMITAAIVGGGILLLVGGGYLIMKL
jgi:hypothetical protein